MAYAMAYAVLKPPPKKGSSVCYICRISYPPSDAYKEAQEWSDAQFYCCTGTKVQILTHKALLGGSRNGGMSPWFCIGSQKKKNSRAWGIDIHLHAPKRNADTCTFYNTSAYQAS